MAEKQWNHTQWISLILVFLALAIGLSGCARAEARPPETEPVFSGQEPEPPSGGAPTLVAPQELHSSSFPPTPTPSPEPVETEDTPGEAVNPADPAYWDLGEGRPDPNNPAFTVYDLTEEQLQIALRPIRDFYNGMYHSDRLLTLEEASQWIDTSSQAWTDPQMGFQTSHDSFASFGYYPHYEFPIEDPAFFTNWRIHPLRSPEGDFHVRFHFRFEEQRFTVFNQETGEIIVTNPYWGPRLMVFHTAFRDGVWKIIFRFEENLGMRATPTP